LLRARVTTILLVEPQAHFLASGADVLTRAGYEVISSSTIDDALDFVSRFDPTLILLDGNLAQPSVLEELARSTVRPLSIIFTFQQGRGAQLMAMLDLSVSVDSVEVIGFVEKPFAPDVLMTTVDEGIRAALDAAEDDPESPFDATQKIFTAREEDTQISQIIQVADVSPQGSTDNSGALYRALGLDISQRIEQRDSRTIEPELPQRASDVLNAQQIADASRAYRLAERICSMMPERYPLHPAQMCAIASACEEALREENTTPAAKDANAVAEGSLAGIPPFQVLQLAENLGSTVLCRFTRDETTIEVWLRDRHVVWASDHVRFNDTEQLVYEVLSWNEGRFSVITNATVPQIAQRSRLAIPLAALLLEGLSRIDEWRRVDSPARLRSPA
jgi:DNA-binding response OmpR family regulator